MNKIPFDKRLILLVLCIAFVSISCEDDDGCETETVCFGQGNCIERPVEGSCFN